MYDYFIFQILKKKKPSKLPCELWDINGIVKYKTLLLYRRQPYLFYKVVWYILFLKNKSDHLCTEKCCSLYQFIRDMSEDSTLCLVTLTNHLAQNSQLLKPWGLITTFFEMVKYLQLTKEWLTVGDILCCSVPWGIMALQWWQMYM